MQKVFVSYKFRDLDRQFAKQIADLIESHLLEVDTGEDLGGEPLWPAVRERITACDALVSVFLSPNDPSNHRWPERELDHASSTGKKVFALVEEGFQWSDPENREHGVLNRNSPLEAFLKLSKTIGRWREQAGRTVAVRLLPDNVARLAAKDNRKCRYRLFREREKSGNWQVPDEVVQLGEGYVFWASGVSDDHRIQVEVGGNDGPSYSSAAERQIVSVSLKGESE